ncbi:MAG: tetratricopeptide repeat protein [Myxococcales bacterium]|nr:tetratricopeptide repeat protein [Myxococcales bacterium]
MTCLDDVVVLRAIQGELAPAELAQLDAHLDGCGACRALVGAAGLALGSAPAVASSDALAPGTTLGRYQLGPRLGAGAMGVVYAAQDPELERAVAIKLVRPERAADRPRLVREAQAMARLAHPNVVTIHDVGRHGDDVYVAMERVDGPTLRTWAATRPLAERVTALIAIARGLQAVHAVGLVHRDVKPDNVLVGADGRPRLGDFGLAHVDLDDGAAPPPALSTTVTATGAVVGTPAYMAPEVLRGEPATPASDQWSFAVMAWELIAGRRPFEGDDLAALRRAIDAGLPDIAWRVGTATRPLIVLVRALALRPADRYRDLAALADALAGALAPRSLARPLLVLGAGAVAAVAIAVVLARGGGAARSVDACAAVAGALDPVWGEAAPARAQATPAQRDALDRYVGRWRGARRAVCEAARHERDALADVRAACLTTRAAALTAVVDGLGRDGAWALAIADLADPDECATSPALALYTPVPASDRPAVTALAAQIAQARVRGAVDLDGALAALAPLAAAAERLGHRPTQAAAQLAIAELRRRQGRYVEADRAAEAAALAAAAGHDDLTAARAWLVRVGVAGDRRDLIHAGEWLPHAAAAVERAGAPTLLAAQVDNSAGLLALNQGRLDDADAALARALTARTAIAGDDVEVARTLSALGHLARLRGELPAARAHHERALAIDRAALGPDHVDVGRDLHNLGGVLRLAGDLDGAAAAYREALTIRTAALGADHPDVGLVHNSLGILALDRGRLDDAERELTAARAIFAAHDHLDLAIALANLARVALARGDGAAALATITDAIALDRAQLPARHPRLAANLIIATRAALATRATATARALATEAAAALTDDDRDAAAELDGLRRALAPRAPTIAARAAAPDAGPPPHDASTPVDAGAGPVDAGAPADATAPLDAYVPRGVYGSSQGWN